MLKAIPIFYKAELSGFAPDAIWVPPAFLADGDLWRVEVIPVEVVAQTKIESTTGVEQELEELQGEIAWYEVFVGENSVPTISLLSPGSQDVWVLDSHTWLGWKIADSDGDALTLELF